MGKLNLLFVATFAVILWSFLPTSRGENPGFRTAITAKGLTYIQQVGISILEESLKSLKISDLSGRVKLHYGIGRITFHWTLSKLHVESLDIPTSDLTSGSNGLTLKASGVTSKVTGHIHVDDGHDFPHISASSDASVTFSGISFAVSFLIGKDTKGHPIVTTSSCSATISKVHVSFHGGSSWVYKVVDKIADFDKQLSKHFEPTFCKGVTEGINNQGNKALESLPVMVKIDKYAEINYALVKDPIYTTTYVAMAQKGEFESLADPTDAPFSPPVLPDINSTGTNQMIYVWLTEYIANTAGLVYHNVGFFVYNITPDMVPKELPIKLNTASFKGIIPELYKKYPNMDIELSIRTTKPPHLQINPGSANLTTVGEINVQVILPNKDLQSVFTLGLTVFTNIYFWIHSESVDQIVSGNVTLLKFNFNVTSSNIGSFSVEHLNKAVNYLVDLFVIKAFNYFGAKGIVIPLMDGVSFINPKLQFGEGYILISSDIHYILN